LIKSRGAQQLAPATPSDQAATAGAIAAARIGVQAGYPNLVACDMGGTSFDVSLIAAGADTPAPTPPPKPACGPHLAGRNPDTPTDRADPRRHSTQGEKPRQNTGERAANPLTPMRVPKSHILDKENS